MLGEGGAPGAPAALADLASFRAQFPFANDVLDAGFAHFGGFFDATAVPSLIFLDARTMEIVIAGVGGIETPQEIDANVDTITSGPPSY